MTRESLLPAFRLRRCILTTLYEIFKEVPYASVELGQILETCDTTAETLNWNIVYLEKKGYVELVKSYECSPYVACSASITGEGIDLAEDEASLDLVFPSAIS